MICNYLVDTDILIWYLKGNQKAKKLLHSIDFSISVVTYIELMQGMRNKQELISFKKMMESWNIKVIYIDEEISAKALFYIEEYCLSHSMALADALIASTCTKYGYTLVTANDKHYRHINSLHLDIFRPEA